MSRLEEIEYDLKLIVSAARNGSKLNHEKADEYVNHLVYKAQKSEELQAKVDGLEERKNFLERAHKTNIKIAEYAKEENQHYKQALEEVKSLTINPREYQPSTYTIHHIVSDALKGVEGCEGD
ncbi:hypothetical protein M3E13_15520 [Oceanobacillus kimchii]|uniref:hypothetical protein n=1 Tax=Oceanobacillus kimchii TaxID=746691 RepID=UPI0021A5F90A|nr:hypothetical protein [Oceanobacillus kimchii]MCT1575674.1 hypothetical protein [Oceanobacillus kimchii]MCT2137305.1 hypothetical protein [Oceanobacillus kimchii]